MRSSHLGSKVLAVLLSYLGVLVVGVAVYGGRVFDPGLAYFQFVAGGVVCGAYLLALRSARGWATILVAVAILAALVLPRGSELGSYLARDAVWVAGLLVAVRVGVSINRSLGRIPLGKFVLWALAFGAIHFLMHAILSFANSVPIDPRMARVATTIGALMGAGFGLGLEFSEFVGPRVWPEARIGTEAGP